MKTNEKVESTPIQDATPQEPVVKPKFPSPFAKADEVTPPVEEKVDEKSEKVEDNKTPETEPKESVSEYLSLEDFADKLVKVKVDGQESEISLKDVIKGYQTDKHLSQKGQKLAEEFKRLQDMQIQPPVATNSSLVQDTPELDEFADPQVVEQAKRIKELEDKINGLNTVVEPLKYERIKANIDAEFKAQGFDDFMAHIPEIESRVLNLPIDKMGIYNTEWGFKSIYKDIKLEEMKATLEKSAEPKISDERPTPNLVPIEGAGGSPSGADNFESQYKSGLKRAKQTGDFTDLIKLKYAK